MSTTFLFGAGASFGSGDCHPYAPPLGRDLFPKLQEQGGMASRVSPDLAAVFIDDFEAGMDRFWEEHNADTAELLRDMARYFAKFDPGPENLYAQLIKAMGPRKKYVMATTNYDLLIEMAAGQQGIGTYYNGLPNPEGTVSVLKIHGSCNFIPDAPEDQFQGIRFVVKGDLRSIVKVGIRAEVDPREVIRYCITQDSLAPALAMYSPSKRVLFGLDTVIQQQEAWRVSVEEAARIYIIGMRVHPVDEHIWGLLAKAKGVVYYVGRDPASFTSWAKSVKLKNGRVLASSFAEALPRIAQHHRRSRG